MGITRRSVAAVAGGVLATSLAGCSSIEGGAIPSITSRQIVVENKRCADSNAGSRSVTITSYHSSESRLTFEGTTTARWSCMDLALTAQTGVGKEDFRDDSVHITVNHGTKRACSPCPAELHYSATVEFDIHPSNVYIYHIENRDDIWERVGPIVSKELGGGFLRW